MTGKLLELNPTERALARTLQTRKLHSPGKFPALPPSHLDPRLLHGQGLYSLWDTPMPSRGGIRTEADRVVPEDLSDINRRKLQVSDCSTNERTFKQAAL